MGLLLILAQVALIVLGPVAHVITLNLWLVFLPAILFGIIWDTALLTGTVFAIDTINPFAPRRKKK